MKNHSQSASLTIRLHRRGRRAVVPGKPRSLPITEWPKADRDGWDRACQPGRRPGGLVAEAVRAGRPSAYSAKCDSTGAGVSHESRNRIRQRKLIHRQLRRIEISKGWRRIVLRV